MTNIYSYINNDSNKYNDVLNKLQDYMLTESNINQFLIDKKVKSIEKRTNVLNVKSNKITQIDAPKISKKENPIFFPTEKDSLFWCFYIMKNGHVKYETLYNKMIVSEKQIKIEYIEQLRKQKDIIKMYKFATITHIENNLANENQLDVKTFLTLCATNNLNVIVVIKKTYYELLMNDSEEIYLIHNKNGYKYGYEANVKDKIEIIRNSFLKIENNQKPIKAISSYKISDLLELCNKLGIETNIKETGKQKNKKDLYELLVQYF